MDELEWFTLLQRKYVQRADERQKSMGLVYMEAETHDLARTIALHAQADARPAGHFFKASRVHPWVQVEKECPNAVPLYTHPEASAQGLSDEEIKAGAHRLWLLEGQGLSKLEHYEAELRSILTRTSAAAVAEPSEYQDSAPQLHVGDSSFESWYQDYAAKLSGNPKQTARDAYAAGMGDLLVVARKAAQQQAELPKIKYLHKMPFSKITITTADHQQQAEPGADERAAWFAVVMEAAAALENVSYCTRDEDAKHQVIGAATYARERAKVLLAAQSGQRAGVAEVERDAAYWRAAVDHHIVPKYVGDLTVEEYLDEEIAAAPTQQQEGSKE